MTHPPELLALLQECRLAPDEPTPRLVLADWLEDDGQGDLADCVRLSARLPALMLHDSRLFAWRALLDEPRREAGRWLAPLRKRFPGAEFHAGLLRITAGPMQLLAIRPEELPAEYLPWLETLRLRNFTTNSQIVQLAQRGWLQMFSRLDLDQSGLGDWAIEPLLQETRVSHSLRQLVRLDFRYNQLTAEGVRLLVDAESELPALRSLALSSNRRLGDASAEILARSSLLGRLTSLELEFTNLTPVGVTALAQSRFVSNLIHLDIGSNVIGAAGLQALCRARRLTRLQSLSLSTGRFDRKDWQQLSQWPTDRALKRLDVSDNGQDLTGVAQSPLLASVEQLDLGGTGLTARALRSILEALPGPGMQRLELRRTALGDDGAAALAECAALEQLRELQLEDTGIGPRGVLALARSPHLRNVECLAIGSNRLGAEGLSALARGTLGGRREKAIDPFPALRAVGLERTRPTRKGIEALAGSPLLARMEVLDLGNNRLGADGARVLAGAAGMKNLIHLDLGTCSLGDEGVKALAGSRHLRKLRSLNLRQDRISDTGVAELVDSPNLGNLIAVVLRLNRITEVSGDRLKGWRPGEWALFDLHYNRLTTDLMVKLVDHGVKGG